MKTKILAIALKKLDIKCNGNAATRKKI